MLSDLEKMIPSSTDIDDALRAGAEPVCGKMIELAPVKTSKLKNAIKIGKFGMGKEVATLQSVFIGEILDLAIIIRLSLNMDMVGKAGTATSVYKTCI